MSDPKLDTRILLKLTNDCFSRMNNNIKVKEVSEQRGGRVGCEQLVLDSIIPYLISIDTTRVSGSTKVPEAILNTVVGKASGRFDMPVALRSVLDRNDINVINHVLTNRPHSY